MYLIYFSLIFFIVYSIYIINSKEPTNKKLRREIRSIVQKGTFKNHLFNDFREEFLPNTQFIKVDYKVIDLDFLNLNDCYFGKCYTFFLEQYDDKVIIADRKGKIKFTSFADLDKKNQNFKSIQTNLNFDYILDILIDENDIYISGKKVTNQNETILEIVHGKFNDQNINFESIIKLRSEKCILRHAVHSGKMQFIDKANGKMLLAINSSGGLDQPDPINLSADSICGKTLLVNILEKNYEIFTSGHRNMIGLYVDKDVIIGTEHGPFAGDEINRLVKNKSYGWPEASYGEKYSRNQNNNNAFYAKDHSALGFEEPIFSFVPAIGISEIIKLPNNFSDLWQDNFLLGSLNGKYLYRIKFDKNYSKILYYEPIYIGERIRDLMYNNKNKKILLSLELKGSLGIISN